jgi:hypothetical protein
VKASYWDRAGLGYHNTVSIKAGCVEIVTGRTPAFIIPGPNKASKPRIDNPGLWLWIPGLQGFQPRVPE